MSTIKRILVTGGAGFLGSHLCERLVAAGHDVICLDNFFTSQKSNVAHLIGRPNFELIRHDVTVPIFLEVDQIYNLACPAAPGHYQYNPIKTVKTSVHGRDQRAGHGQTLPGARAAGVHERGLRRPGDPSAAGNVSRERQSARTAGLLRRGQAGGGNAVHGLLPHEPRRHPDRADLQYLRTAHASLRRPRRVQLYSPGAGGRGHHDLRRRRPDPLVLLLRRPDRGPGADDGAADGLHRPGQPRQSGRVHAFASWRNWCWS